MDEREKRRIEKERREKEQQRIFVEGLKGEGDSDPD